MLLWLILLASLLNPIEVSVNPSVGFAPLSIRVKTQVERREENREVCVQLNGSSYSTSSCESLDGVASPRTFWRTWEHIPEGEYEVVGVLRQSNRTIKSRAVPLKVLGPGESF